MDKYYYHGIGDIYFEDLIDIMITIINSGGLKTRNEIRSLGEEYNHICLYKKNDDYDYSKEETILSSARGGWIDHCLFFIISPDIEAEKVEVGKVTEIVDGKAYTNLIDEWRSKDNIPLDKIVGIAIPFDGIKETRSQFPETFSEDFDNKLNWLIGFATDRGWMIENSDEKDLCDRLDQQLSRKKNNK